MLGGCANAGPGPPVYPTTRRSCGDLLSVFHSWRMFQSPRLCRTVAGLYFATAIGTPWWGVLGSQSATPRAPDGLWWDPQKGAVVRIRACVSGADDAQGPWCGYVASVPMGGPPDGATPRCGTRLFHNFAWNARQQRWAGRISPPDAGRTISATARTTPDSVHFTARVLFVSRTLLFVRYPGTVTTGCESGVASPPRRLTASAPARPKPAPAGASMAAP
jgi:hypothetical protein